ncbi:hypothetical protein LXL04_001898 [Taraxacum kok-saghyz]
MDVSNEESSAMGINEPGIVVICIVNYPIPWSAHHIFNKSKSPLESVEVGERKSAMRRVTKWMSDYVESQPK